MTILMGTVALVASGRLGVTANLIAGLCYIAATLLVYELLRPVNKSLSLLAASFSLMGCASGLLSSLFHLPRLGFVFFGFHLLLLGYLIFRSTLTAIAAFSFASTSRACARAPFQRADAAPRGERGA